MNYLKRLRRSRYESLLFLISLLLLLFSFLLQGFLPGHEGHAGPHLLSASINSLNFGTDFLFDEIYINTEGVTQYSLYNHHPSFPFYLDKLLFRLLNNPDYFLPAAYFKAVLLNLLGVWLIFIELTKKYNQKTAFFAALSILGSLNISEFLNLATFDSYSILSSVLFFKLISNLRCEWNKKSVISYTLYILILLSVSWYNHLIFYILIGLVIVDMILMKDRLILSGNKLFVLLCGVCYSTFIIVDKLTTNLEIELLGTLGPKGFVPFRIPSYTFMELVKLFTVFVIKTSPVSVLLLVIIQRRKLDFIKRLDILYLTPVLYILIFFFLDIQWNLIHGFLSLYIVPFTILIAFQSPIMKKIPRLLFWLQISLFIVVTFFSMKRDLVGSRIYADKLQEFASFNYFSNCFIFSSEKPIQYMSEDELPLGWNKGQLFYILSIYSDSQNECNEIISFNE